MHSELSLGMLHDYFEDRAALIIYCVELYKEDSLRNFRIAAVAVSGRDQVIAAVSDTLVTSIVDEEMTIGLGRTSAQLLTKQDNLRLPK